MKIPELKRIRLLAGWSENELEALGERGEIITFSPGEVLFKQGQRADAMYFILKGKVGAYATGPGDGDILLKTIETGGHFGEIGLLQSGARTANVRAIEPCRLFRLNGEAFQGILKTPEIGVPLLHSLSRSLALRLAVVTTRFTELRSSKDVLEL